MQLKRARRITCDLTVGHAGTLWLQLVSLFPPTYHNSPNGNRIDLMEKLAAMHPQFLRFPGGNYLEGDTINERFDWKKTIGPLVDRPGAPQPMELLGRPTAWGCSSSWSGARTCTCSRVLAVYAGYSLHGEHVNPGPDLEPYVQDALDEIEYVTGGPDTKWGAERVKDGHRETVPADTTSRSATKTCSTARAATRADSRSSTRPSRRNIRICN